LKPSIAAQKIEISQYGQLMVGLPWLIALKQGYIKAAGLDIDGFLSGKGGGTSLRNLLASGLPFGEVASSAAISAIKANIDLRVIYGAVNNFGALSWMTTPDKPISSIKDLVGHKVGYTAPKSSTEMMLRMSLDAAGISPDQVTMVSTGGLGGGLSALKAGAIDAAPIVEPVLSKSGSAFKKVFRAADVVPSVIFTFGVTTPEFAKKNPEMIRKLIAVRRKAVDWLYANPDKAVPICAEYMGIDEALAARILPKFIAWKYWSPGSFEKAGLDANIKGLHLIGAVQGTVDWSKYIDQRFLPEDLRKPL